MVYLRTIIYANSIPFLIMLIFMLLIIYNPIFDKRQEKLFLTASVIETLMLVVISINYIVSIADTEGLWWLRNFTSFLSFSISPIIPLFLYKISFSEKCNKLFYLPLMLNVIFCFISMFNGMIFSTNINNEYSRGALFSYPFLTVIFYMFTLILKSSTVKSKGKKYESHFLFSVILLLSYGITLEVFSGFQFLSWVCAVLSLPLYYLLLNINHAILDPLTNVYNRLMYTKDLARIEGKKNCVHALLDINNFKLVNDTYGHEVGDDYLKIFSSTLSKVVSNVATIYRIGGDEFAILSKKENEVKIQALLEFARVRLKEEHISFSYGIATYEKDLDINTFLNGVDQLMYVNKKKDKEALSRQKETV